MHPAAELGKLEGWTKKRLSRLKALRLSSVSGASDESISFIIIELDNLLHNLFQFYVISCLVASPKSTHSGRVANRLAFQTGEEVMAYALSMLNIKKFKQLRNPSSLAPRDWPRSRNPKDWEKVLANASCSVIPSFQRALSLNASVFSRIGVVRNFYAHRNGATAARVIHMATLDGVFPISHPKEYCLAVSAGRVLPNVDEWITELELFAREMVY
ncbi:hypothetical protein ES703_113183 [subsurface metagenome]